MLVAGALTVPRGALDAQQREVEQRIRATRTDVAPTRRGYIRPRRTNALLHLSLLGVEGTARNRECSGHEHRPKW